MTHSREDSPINSALRQFEATEANVAKLGRLWSKIAKLIPGGLQFGSDPAYEEYVRRYEDLLRALPRIDGWKPERAPMDLDAIGQMRLDAKEVGEISAEVSVENEIEAPGRELAEYRHRLNAKRRQLVRAAMTDSIAAVDAALRSLSRIASKKQYPAKQVESPTWEKLKSQIQGIEALLGDAFSRPARWNDLQRHLHFGTVQDLADIVRLDWPDVKGGLTKALYDRDEPIPVDVPDLGTLAAAQPKGQSGHTLEMGFVERRRFRALDLFAHQHQPGLREPEWLMHTKAPDRGRDLSVSRIVNDPLSGAIRSRVLIQCRHWMTKSVSASDVAVLKEQITTWEPPKVDVLIVATTGRFTSNAVAAIEKDNAGDRALKIEMWPESHLERLLAERPALIAEFGLR